MDNPGPAKVQADSDEMTAPEAITDKTQPGQEDTAASPDLGEIPRPVFIRRKWDKNDRSFEDARRPPLRKTPGPNSMPSARDEAEKKEIQLQEDEAARRKALQGLMSMVEVEAKLEEEFGQRRRQLQLDIDALRSGT